MESVRLCAVKLGYTVFDRKIASKAEPDVYAEREVIVCVCAKNTTIIVVIRVLG